MSHSTSRALPALPLRLAAEPIGKSVWSSCVALGVHAHPLSKSHGSLEIAVLVDDDGIRAFCFSSPVSRRVLLDFVGLPLVSEVDKSTHQSEGWKDQPMVCLIRASPTSNDMEWYRYNDEDEFPTKTNQQTIELQAQEQRYHDPFVARLLTESIRLYYAQQILEPSVRGFLSVLEKQFARSDLYLFELLQNAVDDGATVVRFSITHDKKGSATQSALRLTHNGRNFTPLDVLGLSSVGLSTKSREGKRTIGFMGVGFKAVYKRFATVKINDGTYAFAYKKPVTTSSTSGSYGWVMQPLWMDSHEKREPETGTEQWCHFDFERAVGGMAAVDKDLSVLPPTAPPLLGRAALEKQSTGSEDSTWTLDWNHKVHNIRRIDMRSLDASTNSSFCQAHNRSEVVTVDMTDRSGRITQTRWLFLSHKYIPGREATVSYRNHTKRSHSGQEEVCGFVRLGGTDGLTPLFRTSARTGSTVGGIVHSVLPTKLRMPVPMNVQGAWLLSVDRQEVQDLGDNEWNKDLVHRLPMLIANFFRWAAREGLSTAEHYRAIGKLLPTVIASSLTNSISSTELLGQTVSLGSLEKALFSERILPVAMPEKAKEGGVVDENAMDADTSKEKPSKQLTDFYEGKNSIWVPPSFFKFLGPAFLRGWLGKRPLRSDLFGDAAFHPLFSSKKVIGQLDAIHSRREQLVREIGVRAGRAIDLSTIGTLLCLMAAVGAACDEHPSCNVSSESEAASKKRSTVAGAINDCAQVPVSLPLFPSSMASWPIFLTESGELSSPDKLVIPLEDFAVVPETLRVLLRPFFVRDSIQDTEVEKKRSQFQKKGRQRGGGKNRKFVSTQATQRKPQTQRLHPMLEDAIFKIDSGRADFSIDSAILNGLNQDELMKCAASFLSRARTELPSNTISVVSATSNLLASYSNLVVCGEDQVSTVLSITEYALSTSNPLLLSYVLVDSRYPNSSSSSPATIIRVIPANEAYIGKAVDEVGPGCDLESFAGDSLRFLSSRYSAVATSAAEKLKLNRLFDEAGVQNGLSATVSAIIDLEKTDRKLLANDILPKLPEKKLPQSRKNQTKKPLHLPYGLRVPMDRRKYSLLDAQFPMEWEKIVKNMSPEAAAGFVSILLALPVDDATIVTQKTTPVAANLLNGQEDAVVKEEMVSTTNEAPLNGHKTVRLGKEIAVPLRRRLVFLPPGKAGGSMLDVSEATIVKQLSRWKWLPCTVPSQSDAVFAPKLYRPEEALLSPDKSRPEMPIVQLSPALLKRLSSSAFAKALEWGTRAPPPPVTRLGELAKAADEMISSEGNNADLNSISRLAEEMISTWTAIARAHLRGDGLTARDRIKLRNICNASRCIPVRRVLGSSHPTTWIVPVSRCVLMPEHLSTSVGNDGEKIKGLTVSALLSSSFLFDFNDIKSNIFFSQPDVSGAVVQLASIPKLANLTTKTLTMTSGAFVRYCCASEPIISHSSPLRAAFSYTMKWCIETPDQLPKGEHLKLFVRRGPGAGSKALPARWLSLKNGPVQVVLDDDKSRARHSLLTPEMGVQLLGVLDHFPNERDCPNAEILAAIDRDVVDFCGVLRLSDKRFSVKTRARDKPILIEGAATRLQLVLALLKDMEVDRLGEGGSVTMPATDVAARSGGDFLTPAHEPPVIVRHESLTREFLAPWMNTPSSTQLFAVWGRAKNISSKRCILVSGEPEDYSVELEQLVLNYVGIRSVPSLASTKDYRAALRLLSHLESDTSFEKFLKRDFDDSDVTIRWRKLSERVRILQDLKKAEKSRSAKALRQALVAAEEACEEDDDEGDSVLKSARELLPKLEEEAKAQREAEEKKKLEEKEREALKEAALREEKEAFEKWKQEEKAKALSKLAGEDAVSETTSAPSAPRGRGRGLTLPAWVTAGVGPSNSEKEDGGVNAEEAVDISSSAALKEAETLLSSIVNENMEMAPAPTSIIGDTLTENGQSGTTIPTGRGRGISNLPAWMTSSDSGGTVQPVGRPGSESAGRGRGVSNLPAWMTSDDSKPREGEALVVGSESENFADAEEDSLKRRHPEEMANAEEEDGRPNKKARSVASSFEFVLKVSIEASKLPEFVAMMRPKIEEGVQLFGGSASFERLDS